MFILLVFCLFY